MGSMDLQGKIAVLGLGLSGMATLRALSAGGCTVVAWDDNPGVRAKAPADSIAPLDKAALQSCTLVISAPGIPDDNPTLELARACGVEVICDVELWHRLYPQAQTIGITGTNGKSTLTAMTHHIARKNGVKAQMGGNIGHPVFDLTPPRDGEWIVLELSSFQIERCPTFRPTIAAILNITPDHLDRHGTMERYAAIKASLCEGEGTAIIATEDIWTQQIAQMVEAAGTRDLIRVQGSAHAQHQNRIMALAIADCLGIDQNAAEQALETYDPLPHRQNTVRTLDGVTYINDSKATNAQATRGALQNFDDIIWIVGGHAKEGGLDGVADCLDNVRHACIIGADTAPFMAWLSAQDIPCSDCGTMAAAVQEARRQAQARGGKTILLSPACASYDQYLNFMQRGDDFASLVQGLDDA